MTFLPGKSGNPNGRPRLSDDARKVRDLAKDELLRTLSAVLLMNQEGLDRIETSYGSSNAMRLSASLVKNAIDKGCPIRAQFIYNYIIGKPEPHKSMDGDEGGKTIIFETQLADGMIRTSGTICSKEIDAMVDQVIDEMLATGEPTS